MQETIDAQALKEEGMRLFQEGLYEEAAERFSQAQETFAADENAVEAAEMVNNLGVVYRVQGRWDEAITALEEAKAAFVRLGDRSREAQTLGNLGGLYASKKERERAQECLRQAADIFGELGDEQRRGETLIALGLQEFKTGDRAGGLATYGAGLQTLEKPTAGQSVTRGLIKLYTRLLGGKGGSKE